MHDLVKRFLKLKKKMMYWIILINGILLKFITLLINVFLIVLKYLIILYKPQSTSY